MFKLLCLKSLNVFTLSLLISQLPIEEKILTHTQTHTHTHFRGHWNILVFQWITWIQTNRLKCVQFWSNEKKSAAGRYCHGTRLPPHPEQYDINLFVCQYNCKQRFIYLSIKNLNIKQSISIQQSMKSISIITICQCFIYIFLIQLQPHYIKAWTPMAYHRVFPISSLEWVGAEYYSLLYITLKGQIHRKLII